MFSHRHVHSLHQWWFLDFLIYTLPSAGYVTVPPPGSGQHSQTDNKEKSFEDVSESE